MRADTPAPSSPVGLVAQAAARPDAVALIEGDQPMTYAELDDRARRVAQVLSERGVEAGDRVGVMVPNSIEWFEAVHGIGRLGAITVPVNSHFKADEVGHVLVDSGAVAVIIDAGLVEALGQVSELPRLVVGDGYAEALAAAPEGDVTELGGPDRDGWPTTMLYTSGTTGKPKGVAVGDTDFRRTAAGFAMMAAPFGMSADDTHLLVGPSYHAGPAVWAQVNLAVGGTVVIMPRWNAEQCLALIETHQVTTTHVVPANFIQLLALPDATRAAYDLSSLRHVWHAAAPCPEPVKRRIMEWFPEGSVWEYYGASEGGGTSISPEEWLAHPGSVGRPYPGHEFRIRDEAGRDLPPGQTGVIWVSSQFTSFRYHNDSQKTADTFGEDGLFSVGDMGYIDEGGYVYITDRKSDMVISGGVNIYPREVENCLYDHPDVVDCAVFGVPDDDWGEVLLAVVQGRTDGASEQGPLTAEDVVAWCREHLADYKRPRHVEFVDELARDPNGKVVKRRLRDEYLTNLAQLR